MGGSALPTLNTIKKKPIDMCDLLYTHILIGTYL